MLEFLKEEEKISLSEEKIINQKKFVFYKEYFIFFITILEIIKLSNLINTTAI